jgi:hypothetical protein
MMPLIRSPRRAAASVDSCHRRKGLAKARKRQGEQGGADQDEGDKLRPDDKK